MLHVILWKTTFIETNHPECWWFGLFLGRWFPLHHLSKLLQLPEYQHSIQAAVTSSGFYGDATYTASSGGNTNVFMMPIFPHPPSPSSVLNAAVSYSPHGVCQAGSLGSAETLLYSFSCLKPQVRASSSAQQTR